MASTDSIKPNTIAAAFRKPYIIDPKAQTHTKTVVFVHGRGSQGEEFASELFQGKTSNGQTLLDLANFTTGVKWVFPSAHERYSTVFQKEMDEWFDIYSLSNPNDEQERQKGGLREAAEYIHGLLQAEIDNGIKPQNIILAGISQGFATSIHALLICKHQLGGFVGLCGWMPFSDKVVNITADDPEAIKKFYKDSLDINAATTKSTLRTPIFISHHKDDSVVESTLGRNASECLKSMGFEVEWHQYEDNGKDNNETIENKDEDKEEQDCKHWIGEPQRYDDLANFMFNQVYASQVQVKLSRLQFTS